MDSKEKLQIELLQKEYDNVWQGIRNLSLAGSKVIALGLTIIAAGLTLGVKEKILDILLLLPIAIYGVLFYGIHISTELISLGGYKRYLEEKLNGITGNNILLWELSIARRRHSAFGKNFLYIIYVLFLVLTILGYPLHSSTYYILWFNLC